jgi:cardiolipin synthase
MEAGVRLFEWEGPMIHAKTAGADGVWSRVGSSNLNLASLLGNWELDVAILDRQVANEMEELFIRDMQSSVELRIRTQSTGLGNRFVNREPVLEQAQTPNQREVAAARSARQRAPRGRRIGRIVGRVARASSVLGRALVGQRLVGREDRSWIVIIAVGMLGLAVLGLIAPRLLAWPLAFLLFWLGIASLIRAVAGRGSE